MGAFSEVGGGFIEDLRYLLSFMYAQQMHRYVFNVEIVFLFKVLLLLADVFSSLIL